MSPQQLNHLDGALELWAQLAAGLRQAGYAESAPEYLRFSRMLRQARLDELEAGASGGEEKWQALRQLAATAHGYLAPLVEAARVISELPGSAAGQTAAPGPTRAAWTTATVAAAPSTEAGPPGGGTSAKQASAKRASAKRASAKRASAKPPPKPKRAPARAGKAAKKRSAAAAKKAPAKRAKAKKPATKAGAGGRRSPKPKAAAKPASKTAKKGTRTAKRPAAKTSAAASKAATKGRTGKPAGRRNS